MRHKKIITLILSFFLMTSVLCTGVLADEEPLLPGFHTYYNETFENSGMRFFATDEDGDGLTWTQVSDGKAYEGLKYVTTPTSKDTGFSDKTENRLTTNDFVPAKGDFAEFYISAKNPESVGDRLYVYLYDVETKQYTSLGFYSTLSYWVRYTIDLSSAAHRSTRLVFVQKAGKDNPGINLDNFRIWRQDYCDTISRVEPTCTTNGHKEYYQANRKEYYFEDKDFKVLIPDLDAWLKGDGLLPATGHTMKHYDRIEPTFDSYGQIEYYECEVCGKKFADKEGLIPLEDTSIPRIENALEDPNQKVIYNPNYLSSEEIAIKSHDEKSVSSISGFAKECYTVGQSSTDLTKLYISFDSECLANLGVGAHKARVSFNHGNDVDIEIVVPEYVELKFVFPGYSTFPGSLKVTADSQADEYFTRTNVYVPKNDEINLEFNSGKTKLLGYTVDGVALADDFVASEDMVITVNTRENINGLTMKPSTHDYGQQTIGYSPVGAYEFVIENDGENDLCFLVPELKNYEIIDVQFIANPNAEGPKVLGNYFEEEDFVYLEPLDKLVLKIKPKDGLAIGKYNEECIIDAYNIVFAAQTLGNEDETSEADISVKADLSFEVIDKKSDDVPTTEHTMKHYDRIEPTFDSEGRKEYYECEVCGKKFADKEGLIPLEDTSIPRIENALEDPNQKVIYNPNYEDSYGIVIKNHDQKIVDSISGFARKCYTVSSGPNDLTKSVISFKSECLAALGTGTHEATVSFNRGNDVDIEIVVPEYVELKFVFPGHDTFPGSMKVTADSQADEYFTRTNVYVPKNDKVNLEFYSDILKLVGYTVDGAALADEFVAAEDMTITVNTREYISSLSMKPSAYDYGQETVGYKAVSPYEFVLENDGENDLCFLLPELKSYEIIDVEVINNPNAEEPMFLGQHYEEENFVYLNPLDKIVLKIKPKDGLAIGKYNEELRIDAYGVVEAQTLGNEDETPEADVSVKANLSFEVIDKERDDVPTTGDSSNIILYGVTSILTLALAVYLVSDRKRRSIK